NEAYVDMDELFVATGKVIAELLETEAAFVTSGCAAAMALGTSACITGNDVVKMERIPDTAGMRNEVVVQGKTRYKYDRCPTTVGARLIVAGDENGTSREQLAERLGPNTACVLHLALTEGTPGTLPLDTVAEVAHSKGVPVLVDAAGEVYPLDYFKSFYKRGADLVCFGAKYFGGPHSTGILSGKKELVQAAYVQTFVGFEALERRTFGRPLKVDRQEAMGVIVALREWMAMDHKARVKTQEKRAARIMDALKDLSNVGVRRVPSTGNATRLAIDLNEAALGKSALKVQEALCRGNPRVWVKVLGPALMLATQTLRDGEDQIVARRLREELS
ncbi:MAG: aminotransferase class V-fold PLP-dependent enzyme, partial [Chloroflexota bacterium]